MLNVSDVRHQNKKREIKIKIRTEHEIDLDKIINDILEDIKIICAQRESSDNLKISIKLK